jgi:trimeric autotransporter adhesin
MRDFSDHLVKIWRSNWIHDCPIFWIANVFYYVNFLQKDCIMNKSYISVWNEALGSWVAASENTAARGKRSKTRVVAGERSSKRISFAATVGALVLGEICLMVSPSASAALYVNDGTDGTCTRFSDAGTGANGATNVTAAACNTNLGTQTTNSVFFGPTGSVGTNNAGSQSLSVGGGTSM